MTSDYVNYAKEINQNLKQYYRDKRNDEQSMLREREKYLNPVIKAQQESAKAIVDSFSKNQETFTNSLMPFTRNIEKRIDQVENLQRLPYYNIPIEDIPQSTPKKEAFILDVNLDKGLNETDRENLSLLELDLPSDVLKNGTYDETLKKINAIAISLGKTISEKDKKGRKMDYKEKEIAQRQRETLTKYREKLNLIKSAYEKEVLGDGLNINDLNTDDIVTKFYETIQAVKNGVSGLSKIGLKLLDQLLRRSVIDHKEYNKVITNYFSKRQRGRPKKLLK